MAGYLAFEDGFVGEGYGTFDDVSTRTLVPTQMVAVELAASSASGADWNDRYQQCLMEDQSLARLHSTCNIIDSFLRLAKQHVQTIVDEMGIEAANRTIPSIDAGGVAGGIKYSKDGIFFKFVKDEFHIYKSDAKAMKVAGAELLGLRRYASAKIPGLHFPLMTLIDYRGYRVIAAARLPLGPQTLVYGSADGGRTVQHSDAEMNALMQQAGQRLLLKPHLVGADASPVELYGPCDIEGHRGKDQRLYVLDTARVCPPETPVRNVLAVIIPLDTTCGLQTVALPTATWQSELAVRLNVPLAEVDVATALSVAGEWLMFGDRSSTQINARAAVFGHSGVTGTVAIVNVLHSHHLYHLLRPELVSAMGVPLSSDAFSYFGRSNAAEHNSEVRQATQHLTSRVIPDFADKMKRGTLNVHNAEQLREAMHRHGINMRYLGALRDLLKFHPTPFQHLVLTDMIIRATKGILAHRLRSLDLQQPDAARQAVVDFINMFCGNSVESDVWWQVLLPTALYLKFGWYGALLQRLERIPEYDFRPFVTKNALFEKLHRVLGLKFTSKCQKRLADATAFMTEIVVKVEDLEGFVSIARPISDQHDALLALIQAFHVLPPTPETVTTAAVGVHELDNHQANAKVDDVVAAVLSQSELHVCTDLAVLQQFDSAVVDVFGKGTPPHALALLLRAHALQQAGHYAEALAVCQQVRNVVELWSGIHVEILSSVLLMQGDLHTALEDHQAALQCYRELCDALTRSIGTSQSVVVGRRSREEIQRLGTEARQKKIALQQEYQRNRAAMLRSGTQAALEQLHAEFEEKEALATIQLYENVSRGHPFITVAVDRHAAAALRADQMMAGKRFDPLMQAQWKMFCVPPHPHLMQHWFGCRAPAFPRSEATEAERLLALNDAWRVGSPPNTGPSLYASLCRYEQAMNDMRYSFLHPEWFCGEFVRKDTESSAASAAETATASAAAPEVPSATPSGPPASLEHLKVRRCAHCSAVPCKHSSHALAAFPAGTSARYNGITETRTQAETNVKECESTTSLVTLDDATGLLKSSINTSLYLLPPHCTPEQHATLLRQEVLQIDGCSFNCDVWQFERTEDAAMQNVVNATVWLCTQSDIPLKFFHKLTNKYMTYTQEGQADKLCETIMVGDVAVPCVRMQVKQDYGHNASMTTYWQNAQTFAWTVKSLSVHDNSVTVSTWTYLLKDLVQQL